MKNLKNLLLVSLMLSSFSLWGQDGKATTMDLPEFKLDAAETEMHLRFLAADELMGRRTTDMGNNVAARYIAEQFRFHGLQTAPGADGYYQIVPFENRIPPKESFVRWGENVYEHGGDMIMMAGKAMEADLEVVFVNYGWIDELKKTDDYAGLDVAGKVVVAISGLPDTQEPSAVFGAMKKKRKIAADKGAFALVELYKLSFPWDFFKSYFGKERLDIVQEEEEGKVDIPYIWLKEKSEEPSLALKAGKETRFKLKLNGFETKALPSQNVIGVLEGSDPVLKNEYILCTAHYDHVGVGKQGGGAFSPEDSIFNGARDNAIGTVALLSAVKTLSMQKPKRSVIFIAFTGEEMGLLGSGYYADHPLIPLNQTVYNLNTDGAGYDDKTAFSVLGYDRVGTQDQFDVAAEAFGLKVIPDPAPEQNLFDRSDNVNFAAKGIPAPTFSPGTTGFSEEIQRYYHQVGDNPETLDFTYVNKFCQAYAYTARLVANMEKAPQWKTGDKYEKAAKELYEKTEIKKK